MDDTTITTLLKSFSLQSMLVSGTDLHQLEYPDTKFKIRHILSGFTGSAGTFILYSHKHSIHRALWTDGRYEITAHNTIDNTTQLFISNEHDYKAQITWLADTHSNAITHEHEDTIQYNNPPPLSIGISDLQTTVHTFHTLTNYITQISPSYPFTITLVIIPYQTLIQNIVTHMPQYRELLTNTPQEIPFIQYTNTTYSQLSNSIWSLPLIQAQYPINTHKINNNHNLEIFTHQIQDTIQRLHTWITQSNAHFYISSNVHELAWLLGMRSMTIPYLMVFPVVFVYSIEEPILYLWVSPSLINTMSQQHLSLIEAHGNIRIITKDYTQLLQSSNELFEVLDKYQSRKIIYDATHTPVALYKESYTNKKSPLSLWKSIRTTQEITHQQECQRQDNIALLEALASIHHSLTHNTLLTESEISNIILQYRSTQPHFLQPSFTPIVAIEANAAQPHYATGNANIDIDKPLLIDSGGHYLYGSTDLTRVMCFGSLFGTVNTPENTHLRTLFRDDFTYVLKAHIALATYKSKPIEDLQDLTQYPTGKILDTHARSIMQTHDRDYNHGTGHGIGYVTDVHEGVQKISHLSSQAIMPNMILTNEPGIYRKDLWGIRIENVMISVIDTNNCIYFQTISWFPIQNALINHALLDAKEQEWLTQYQTQCKKILEPHISLQALDYLNQLIQE